MGVEIDAGIALDLGAKIGDLTSELRSRRQAQRDAIPIDVRQIFTGSGPASGNLAISGPNAGPEQGRLWLVRRVIVAGVTWGTSATGTFELYVGGLPLSLYASVRPTNDLVDQSGGIPNKAFYSNRQVVVQNLENIVGVVVAPAVGQEYVMTVQAEDYAIDATRVGDYEF